MLRIVKVIVSNDNGNHMSKSSCDTDSDHNSNNDSNSNGSRHDDSNNISNQKSLVAVIVI